MMSHSFLHQSGATSRRDWLALVIDPPLRLSVFLGWVKAKIVARVAQDRWRDCLMIGSPLVVVLVATAGLLWLSIANLKGAPLAGHQETEHAAAVMDLFFRR